MRRSFFFFSNTWSRKPGSFSQRQQAGAIGSTKAVATLWKGASISDNSCSGEDLTLPVNHVLWHLANVPRSAVVTYLFTTAREKMKRKETKSRKSFLCTTRSHVPPQKKTKKKQGEQRFRWLTFKCKSERYVLVMSLRYTLVPWTHDAWSFDVCRNMHR